MSDQIQNLTLDKAASRRLYGLRGAAILLVLWDHYEFTRVPFHFGPMAVRLFFVLTGFHITLSFWKARREEAPGGLWGTLKSFYIKRFLRIAPLFYGALLLGALMKLPEARTSLGWDCFFLTNFNVVNKGDWPIATAHFWSLAVQEQFYLLWPLMLVPLACRKKFAAAVTVSIGLSLAFRYYCDTHDVSPYYKWVLLPGCWDSFMAGAVLAHLYARGASREIALPAFLQPVFRNGAWVLLPLGVALAISFSPRLAFLQFLCETLEAVTLAAVTWYVFNGAGALWSRFLENRHMVHLGKASYAIYAFQAFLYFWVWHKVTKHYSAHLTPAVATCTLFVLTAVGVFTLMYARQGADFLRRRVWAPLFS